MHVSQTFLQKVYFILKTMPVSLHRLTRTSRSSFPAAFVIPFPEQGVTSHNLIHSAEVRYFSHKRTYPCCQPGVPSRPHFLGGHLPIIRLHDPAYPPFCIQRVSITRSLTMIQSIIDGRAPFIHMDGEIKSIPNY